MTFEEASREALEFREERDWGQFHNPKDLAISINLEASELLELFQWSGSDVDVPVKAERMKEELADVMIYCIYLAELLGADVGELIRAKISQNREKYPIEKAKGNSRKYSEL